MVWVCVRRICTHTVGDLYLLGGTHGLGVCTQNLYPYSGRLISARRHTWSGCVYAESVPILVMSEFPKVCKYSSTQAISPQCLNVFTSNLI